MSGHGQGQGQESEPGHGHREGQESEPGHGHGHGHGHGRNAPELSEEDLRAAFERPSWEERYAGERTWSGDPNPQLVTEADRLTAGTALDIGCGEGGDATWLAEHGWAVTATDIAQGALDHTLATATERGVQDRITLERSDIRSWSAGGRTWDLVSSQYMHLLDDGMVPLVRELAAAVAPGGTLLVVGHHPFDLDTGLRWGGLGRAMFEADELLPALDASEWADVRTERRDRATRGLEGETVTVHDTVLVARRR